MVKMLIVFVAVFSVIIAANASHVSNYQKDSKTGTSHIDFYANITFYVYQGEGCGCVPIRQLSLNATGRDTDHSASGVTDNNGKCVLQLQYDKTYRVSIQKKDFESVLFDFVVIDDQVFSFHMKELETSSQHLSFIQMILQRILFQKNYIH